MVLSNWGIKGMCHCCILSGKALKFYTCFHTSFYERSKSDCDPSNANNVFQPCLNQSRFSHLPAPTLLILWHWFDCPESEHLSEKPKCRRAAAMRAAGLPSCSSFVHVIAPVAFQRGSGLWRSMYGSGRCSFIHKLNSELFSFGEHSGLEQEARHGGVKQMPSSPFPILHFVTYSEDGRVTPPFGPIFPSAVGDVSQRRDLFQLNIVPVFLLFM